MSIEFDQIVQAVANQHDADIYVYAGPFVTGDERRFSECTRECQSRPNVVLILTTFGGSADAAYQAVRSLRRRYESGHFRLFVPSVCKSAGTLVAVGADEIIMSDTAELGPLDIQIGKQDEVGEFISGLTPTQALDTLRSHSFTAFENFFLEFRFRSGGQISTRMAAEVATNLTVGLFSPIYGQLDPMRVGENARSNLIAVAYGQRIATSNVKHETIERLVSEYPSHKFAIDRDEARLLFERVREPSESELHLAAYIRDDCYRHAVNSEEAHIECISLSNSTSEAKGDAIPARRHDTGEISEATVQADRHIDGAGFQVHNSTNATNNDPREKSAASHTNAV